MELIHMFDFKKDRTKNTIIYKTNTPTNVIGDPTLSLKAKGIYCLILQLQQATQQGYEFSLNNLKELSKDGVDSTRAALNELIANGYIERTKIRESGKITGYCYIVYSTPLNNGTNKDLPPSHVDNNNIGGTNEPNYAEHTPVDNNSIGAINDAENTNVDNTNLGANFTPKLDNPSTLKSSINYKATKYINNTNTNNSSIYQLELLEQEKANVELVEVMDMIGLNDLKATGQFDIELLENFECVIQDMYTSQYTKIGNDIKPRSIMQSRIKKLNFPCLEWTIYQFLSVNTKIYNMTSYIKTMLYNAVGSYKTEPHNNIRATFGY